MTLQKATGTSPETPAATTNSAFDFTHAAEAVKRFTAPLPDFPIEYSRGRDTYDNQPDQRVAHSWTEFWDAIDKDRGTAKGQQYICGPMKFGDHLNKDKYPHEAHYRSERLAGGSVVLPLDCDGMPAGSFEPLLSLLGAYEGCSYTTSSHTEQDPHTRAFVALSRAVNRSERMRVGKTFERYVVARGVVGVKFDASVYQTEQICYLPLKGAAFYHHKGCVALDVDALLSSEYAPEQPNQQSARPVSANIGYRKLTFHSLAAHLNYIDPDDENVWSEVANAVARVYGEAGREYFHAYAIRSDKYDQSENESRYDRALRDLGFRPDGVGCPRLIELAQEHDDYPEGLVPQYEDEVWFAHGNVLPTESDSAAPLVQNGESPWQARARIIGQIVNRYNARYFIATEGGRNFVYDKEFTDELNFGSLNRTLPAAFREIRQTKVVSLPTGLAGADGMLEYEYKPEVELWWKSPERRAYTGGLRLIPTGTCPPDVYNLWNGFGVEPSQGGATSILQFILAVVCNNDQQSFDYLIGWLAHGVQHPERQAEVAIVMRGGKGIGKGTLGKLMKRIYGSHALQITNVKHLTGNFNGHLRSTLLLFADEAFWAGDKAGESVLKGLVTEPTMTIEQKGVDLYTVPNRLKIIMASNAEWVVPASGDERRFFILDVSEERQGDHDYWTTINRVINSDECVGAFLSYLLNYDLSNYNIRLPPNTKALDDQKLSSFDPVNAVLFEALSTGELGGQDWSTKEPFHYPCNSLRNIAVEYCKSHKRHSYDTPNNTSIGKEIKKTFGDIRKRGQAVVGGKRPWIYKFPPLDMARVMFCRRHRLMAPPWEEVDSE